MKRVIMTMVVVVVLMGVSDKALAGPWTDFAFRGSSYGYYGGYGYRPVLGRSSWTNWAFGRSYYGGYGGYGSYGYYGRDRTLGRVIGYGGLAMNVLDMLDQRSINKRVVNNQISATNRRLSMAEKEQEFRHRQIRAQNNTVLVRRGPIVIQVKKPKKIQAQKTQTQENEELRKEVEALKLELEKLKLQQEQTKIQKEIKKQTKK